MQNQAPVALITYNTYSYSQVPITLSSGRSTDAEGNPLTALRQSQKVSSVDLYDAIDVKFTGEMGRGADDFTITFSNYLGKYTDFFLPFQEVEIRIGFPTDPNNINKDEIPLIVVGLIEDAVPTYVKGEGWKMEVTGHNYATLLVDAKLEAGTYHKMTGSSIVQDIITQYGLGLLANIQQSATEKTYQTTLRTSGKAAASQNGKLNANVVNAEQAAGIQTQKKSPIFQSQGTYIDDFIFRGKTAWSAIELLAYYEGTNDPNFNGQEFVAYYNGKVFYYGPRQASNTDVRTMVNLQVGVNIEHYKFSMSTKDLHTRVRIITKPTTGAQAGKKAASIIAPDDLILNVDVTPQEMQGFQMAQQLFGIREIRLRDRDKLLGANLQKTRWIAKAKLKEYSRLVYTGTLGIEYTADMGNENIALMMKDRGIVINGIDAVDGISVTGQDNPQSRRYNGIFYIEKSTISYNKSDGLRISLEVSSRTPEMTNAIQEEGNTISSSQYVVQKPGSTQTTEQLNVSLLKTN